METAEHIEPGRVGGAWWTEYGVEPVSLKWHLEDCQKSGGGAPFMVRVSRAVVRVSLARVHGRPVLSTEVECGGWRVLASGHVSPVTYGTRWLHPVRDADEFPQAVRDFAAACQRSARVELLGALGAD